MEKVLFRIEKSVGESVPPGAVHLNPAWGDEFKQSNTLSFRLGSDITVYLFLHDQLCSDRPEAARGILRSNSIVGYILNCDGQEWTVKTELTSESTFGFIVYTASGKPYLAGEGEVDSSGRWNAKFATIYPGIRNSKKCHLQGGVKGGTGQRTEAQIGGTCSVEF